MKGESETDAKVGRRTVARDAGFGLSQNLVPSRFRASAVDHIHDVAEVLLVGDSIGGLGRKFNLGAKVRGQFGEQLDASDGIEFVATHQRLQRHGGFVGRNTLPEARGEVWILAAN